MYHYFGFSEGSEVYIRIEKADVNKREILADFVESNNFDALNGFYERRFPIDGPSMLLFKDYRGRKLREGTIYKVRYSVLQTLFNQERIGIVDDSFIIRANVNLEGFEEEVFGKAISHKELERRDPAIYFFNQTGNADQNSLQLVRSGSMYVNVKDIGQGSWNEVVADKKVIIVFDTGTHYNTKAGTLIQLLNGADKVYEDEKPALIISHWDVDHYHFLTAKSDQALSSFKFILCRDMTPSLMSRVMFTRLKRLNKNLIAVSADSRTTTLRETPLFDIYNNGRFVIFNSGNSRNRNKNGISMLIKNSTNSILLPGDQHYGQFHHFVLPVYLSYKHTHNIVVPHHGGHAGSYKYILHSKVRKGEAVVSVGCNSYGHPLLKVLKCLRNDRFKVFRTDILSKDIKVQL